MHRFNFTLFQNNYSAFALIALHFIVADDNYQLYIFVFVFKLAFEFLCTAILRITSNHCVFVFFVYLCLKLQLRLYLYIHPWGGQRRASSLTITSYLHSVAHAPSPNNAMQDEDGECFLNRNTTRNTKTLQRQPFPRSAGLNIANSPLVKKNPQKLAIGHWRNV